MTLQNEPLADTSNSESQAAPAKPPTIRSEEDIPFDPAAGYHNASQDELSKVDSLDDEITKFKYLTGRQVLFISMGAMGIAVAISIILSALKIENALVENAFEVFKLIAMTVLGYIFGSKNK